MLRSLIYSQPTLLADSISMASKPRVTEGWLYTLDGKRLLQFELGLYNCLFSNTVCKGRTAQLSPRQGIIQHAPLREGGGGDWLPGKASVPSRANFWGAFSLLQPP